MHQPPILRLGPRTTSLILPESPEGSSSAVDAEEIPGLPGAPGQDPGPGQTHSCGCITSQRPGEELGAPGLAPGGEAES